ncbi:hypothetical protein [Streptomyces bluensis]|uniref:hypothetical protein n=1 Tax=Streptomyces bluensis TaxID=33897 RepID=UPI0019A3F139|nr:hypothetical protein [Streptomyces bluensis]GGZ82207.1 hypothetical protein GCM10010344_56610 [Streptomyces bluensis]
MLIIGVILLAATGAFTGLLIAYNLSGGPEYTVSLFGQHITTMNPLAIFCSGLALALIFCLGLALVLAGSGAAHARHRRPRASNGSYDTTPLHGEGTGDDHGR